RPGPGARAARRGARSRSRSAACGPARPAHGRSGPWRDPPQRPVGARGPGLPRETGASRVGASTAPPMLGQSLVAVGPGEYSHITRLTTLRHKDHLTTPSPEADVMERNTVYDAHADNL